MESDWHSQVYTAVFDTKPSLPSSMQMPYSSKLKLRKKKSPGH